MATKFTDKLAEKAVALAQDNLAEVTQRQAELSSQQKTVAGEVRELDDEMEALAKIIKKNTIPPGTRLSVDEIEKLSCDQETQLEALKSTHIEKTRKLELYKTAIRQVQRELTAAEKQLEKSRAALAVSFERHILESSEVREVLALLRKAQAVWVAAVGNDFFNRKLWVDMLFAEPPTADDIQRGQELMRKSG